MLRDGADDLVGAGDLDLCEVLESGTRQVSASLQCVLFVKALPLPGWCALAAAHGCPPSSTSQQLQLSLLAVRALLGWGLPRTRATCGGHGVASWRCCPCQPARWVVGPNLR